MSNLYAVVRFGMYDRGILGIYTTPELAEAAKLRAKAMEEDNHHGFEVRGYVPDVDVSVINEGQGDFMEYQTDVVSRINRHTPPDGATGDGS